MMTREEATEYFESLLKRFEEMHETETSYWGKVHAETTIEATRLALSALHPVSREQVEKVWRSYWDGFSNDYADGYEVYDEWQCRKCGFEVETDDPETLPQFCPSCGAPMTGEAVEMVMERLEALKDGKGD